MTKSDYPGYQKRYRKAIIGFVAKLLGILVHIDGLPYGARITRNIGGQALNPKRIKE